VIFLPTVRHSGTWFIQGLFKQGGYQVVNLDATLFRRENIPANGKAIIHTHIDVNLPVVKALHAKTPKPGYEIAIQYYEHLNEAMIEAFSQALPTLIPMRDPLLSIITRHSRHPEQAPHTYLVDSWRNLPSHSSCPFFVPVDLGPQPGNLRLALAHCGVKPWPGFQAYADAWKPLNKVPGAPDARAAYARRDRSWFMEHFPEEWAALRACRRELRPLFEQEGYEDLLWW